MKGLYESEEYSVFQKINAALMWARLKFNEKSRRKQVSQKIFEGLNCLPKK